MTNHPNRARGGSAAANPTTSEIIAARKHAGLTQTEAGALVYTSLRNWQRWEQAEAENCRKMHPAIWELFRIKAGLVDSSGRRVIDSPAARADHDL